MGAKKCPPREPAARPSPNGLAWRHSQGAVEPDHLAVDHRVAAQVQHQRGIFGGPAEPAWEWNAVGEALLNVRWQSLQHWRLEEARRDPRHPIPITRHLAPHTRHAPAYPHFP